MLFQICVTLAMQVEGSGVFSVSVHLSVTKHSQKYRTLISVPLQLAVIISLTGTFTITCDLMFDKGHFPQSEVDETQSPKFYQTLTLNCFLFHHLYRKSKWNQLTREELLLIFIDTTLTSCTKWQCLFWKIKSHYAFPLWMEW